jgi:CheY-like chemotaxis protein
VRKQSILIVEDDSSIADLEKRILEAKGFNVEVVGDCAQGLQKLKEGKYDVIISDFSMPNMGGYRFYQEVERLDKGLAGRIIFVTSSVDDFILSSGSRFLQKPFSVIRLVEEVRCVSESVQGKGKDTAQDKDDFKRFQDGPSRVKLDLINYVLRASRPDIVGAIREFYDQPPGVEVVEEREDQVKAYVCTGEGMAFSVMLSKRGDFCKCRDYMERGEVCKHMLVLVFFLIRERDI